ncbi:MAG: UDP-N-acetylmuramate dehydrogenase [Acidimicrobiia bacterium]
MSSRAVDIAAELLGSMAQRDVPYGSRTTYRVGGRAALGMEITAPEQLADVARAVGASGVAVQILGRGSNTLVADRGFDGLLIWFGDWAEQIDIVDRDDAVIDRAAMIDDDGVVTVRAGGAVSLPVLARRTVAAGLTGLEWMVGVPGTIGGAVRMNAGGHGSDMASCLVGVRVCDLTTGEDKNMTVAELGFGFRHSQLPDGAVVLGADLAVRRGDRATSEAELAEIVRWRREKQPGGQNAGSVFVNPLPHTAGALIDAAGLRGVRHGSAEVSTKHANFIQADENGSADDVLELMQFVRSRVAAHAGIVMRSEIRLVGFDTDLNTGDLNAGDRAAIESEPS